MTAGHAVFNGDAVAYVYKTKKGRHQFPEAGLFLAKNHAIRSPDESSHGRIPSTISLQREPGDAEPEKCERGRLGHGDRSNSVIGAI